MNFGGGLDADVRIRAAVEQQRDEFQNAIGAGPGNGGDFLVAVLHREVERRPAFIVGQIHVGSVIDQKLRDGVEAVLHGDQQRAAAIGRGLIHVRACRYQHLHRFHGALTSGEKQGGQAALGGSGRSGGRARNPNLCGAAG